MTRVNASRRVERSSGLRLRDQEDARSNLTAGSFAILRDGQPVRSRRPVYGGTDATGRPWPVQRLPSVQDLPHRGHLSCVVEGRVRGRGVCGLRVVGASVMPAPMGSNTDRPVIVLAEKAADLVLSSRHPARPEHLEGRPGRSDTRPRVGLMSTSMTGAPRRPAERRWHRGGN